MLFHAQNALSEHKMLLGKPPFDLVKLSTLSEKYWKGRAVFHPMEQRGDIASWALTQEDVDDDRKVCAELEISPGEGEVGDACYDTGVVLDWEPDPHFADLGVIRVHFLMSNGSSLRYSSDNLWTPILKW